MSDTPETNVEAPSTFTYTTESGESIDLVAFHLVPAGAFRKARTLSHMHQVFAIVEAGVDEDNLAKVDKLPVSELHDLFDDWTDGATVPNS